MRHDHDTVELAESGTTLPGKLRWIYFSIHDCHFTSKSSAEYWPRSARDRRPIMTSEAFTTFETKPAVFGAYLGDGLRPVVGGDNNGAPNSVVREGATGCHSCGNRTLLDESAYARPYRSEQERRDVFPAWLHTYNHHRGYTALKSRPPASRVPNLTGQYT